MKNKFIIFMILILGFSLTCIAEATQNQKAKKFHMEADITCEDCHGTNKPTTGATEEQCLSCHDSRKTVAERTAKDDPNPHFGHDESISCSDCHKEHEMSTLYCDDCHQWGYTTP